MANHRLNKRQAWPGGPVVPSQKLKFVQGVGVMACVGCAIALAGTKVPDQVVLAASPPQAIVTPTFVPTPSATLLFNPERAPLVDVADWHRIPAAPVVDRAASWTRPTVSDLTHFGSSEHHFSGHEGGRSSSHHGEDHRSDGHHGGGEHHGGHSGSGSHHGGGHSSGGHHGGGHGGHGGGHR